MQALPPPTPPPLDVHQGGGPLLLQFSLHPNHQMPFVECLCSSPPPPPPPPNRLCLLSNRLRSHSCSQMAAGPSPLPKATFSVIQDRRTVRFKTGPPLPSTGPLQGLETTVCNQRLPPHLPMVTGLTSFDRQLMIVQGKLLDPSPAHRGDDVTGVCGTRVLGSDRTTF